MPGSGVASQPFVGREHGVARYERLQAWSQIWVSRCEVKVASSEQSGVFAQLFDLAGIGTP